MNTTIYIELPSIDVVKHFVNDLIAGRYVIDAKSIMGIFSLDLSKKLQLDITGAKESDIEKLKKYCHAER